MCFGCGCNRGRVMYSKCKKHFYILITAILLTDIVILLNILFLRQILGFLFLTLLPGLLILLILKLNKSDFLEKIILAWGISISFLMFFGLLLNNSLLSLGYETPLSTISLLIAFNIAFVVLAISGYKINKELIFTLPNFNLTTSEKIFLIAPVMFPALSIFGMHVMNTTDNNIVLMLMLFLIPIYIVSVCIFNHKFPKRLYPIVIFLISISLLLMLSLRSNHLIGADTHSEYYFFQTTLNNLHWSVFGHSTLDACLAISVLPTIYQSILNVNSEFLFKILYSLLFSIAPLVIYDLSKRYIGELYGFLTSCFFMSQFNFLMTPLHARTNMAILFFALAMMVLFNDKIDPLKKRILFIVFMASCMVSHYSSTYIFFFILLGTFIGMEILLKKYTFKKVISLTIVILFFALIFFWYSQVTEAAFNSGVRFIENTFTNLNKFFVEEMRSGPAQSVFGKDIGEKCISHKIEFVLTWLTFAFIGFGIITLIRRYKEMSFPERHFERADFLKDKFDVGYFAVALVCSGLLVATIALPFISIGYNMGRVHLLGIVILSIFFVIGGVTLSRHLKVRAYLVILLVLIPYFLCTSGVMYNIFGVPRAIILNSEGEQYDMYYLHDQRVIAGKWLSSSEVVDGRLVNKQKTIYNMTEYLDMFDEKNRIYDNGGSEIWK